MNTGSPSYLTASFLASNGIEVTKPLRDWLTRASYLAKNRGSESDQDRYVFWALRTIEEAISAPGGVHSVDWKKLSPVMPPAAAGSGTVMPKMLQTLATDTGAGPHITKHEAVGGDTRARELVLAETLRRGPSELTPFIHQAFELYDRDVGAGRRRYEHVSYLEMMNIAKNLMSRHLQRQNLYDPQRIGPSATEGVLGSVKHFASQPNMAHPAVPPRMAESGLPVPSGAVLVSSHDRRQEAPSPTEPPATARAHKRSREWISDDVRPTSAADVVKAPGPLCESEVAFFGALAGLVASAESRPGAHGSTVSSSCFVGTSTELERRYSRYEPTVEDIRPLPVLHTAFQYIRGRAKEKAATEGRTASLKYLSEQLKGMRQDLRVQNVNDAFAVGVYELHARLCLEIGDLGEFNQCQSALRRMYVHVGVDEKATCCISEFFAYRIVYLSLCQQYDSLATELINYTNEMLGSSAGVHSTAQLVKKEDVNRALLLAAACSEGDCASLMRELQCLPPSMTHLVRIYLQRLRVGWLQEILCGVRGAISLRFLMANLGFTPLRGTSSGASGTGDADFWLDGSREGAEREFEDFFRTVKIPIPSEFSFDVEVSRDATRDHEGRSRNAADTVPCLDAALTREIVENYVAYLGTRKDAIGSATSPTTD